MQSLRAGRAADREENRSDGLRILDEVMREFSEVRPEVLSGFFIFVILLVIIIGSCPSNQKLRERHGALVDYIPSLVVQDPRSNQAGIYWWPIIN